MGKQETLKIIQEYYIKKYDDIFYVITRLGGCVYQSQLSRWLFDNSPHTTGSKNFINEMIRVKLFKYYNLGQNRILLLTCTVFKHYAVHNHAIRLNGTRLIKNAILMERYFQEGYYKREPRQLRDRINQSNCLSYLPTGENHIRLLNNYIIFFRKHGWSTKTLEKELEIQNVRLYNCLHYNKKDRIVIPISKTIDGLDLYVLERFSIYISTVSYSSNKNEINIYLDYYLINELTPRRVANNIIMAIQYSESLFSDYEHELTAKAHLCVYSCFGDLNNYMNNVYRYLSYSNIYQVASEVIKQDISFQEFDLRSSLFAFIDPKNIA